MHNYSSLLAAAQGLLGETAKILNELGPRYIVVGGWSPFLHNTGRITHPGTRDVDILFRDGAQKAALDEVVKCLLSKNYLPSAKHEFQLLRILRVNGIDFVFNVDLLHPGEAAVAPEMFVDHVSLPIPLAEYRDHTFGVKSIIMPEAAFLFDGHSSAFPLVADAPDGGQIKVNLPLMDEVGVVVTKSKSVQDAKRRRDALDIYLAVSQARDYEHLVRQFQRLKTVNESVYNTLYSIREAVEKHHFGERVEELIRAGPLSDSADIPSREGVDGRIGQFLEDVRLEPKASNPDGPSWSGAG
jgi:hypothetical protein